MWHWEYSSDPLSGGPEATSLEWITEQVPHNPPGARRFHGARGIPTWAKTPGGASGNSQ